MVKYLAWVYGLKGPTAQIWYGKATDGNGKAKRSLSLVELPDDDNRSLNTLIKDYPAPSNEAK